MFDTRPCRRRMVEMARLEVVYGNGVRAMAAREMF